MKARFGRKFNGRHLEVILNENDFALGGTYYERDEWNGRCYLMDTARGISSNAAREEGFARRRISAKRFSELYKECEAKIAEYEAWVAKVFGGAA